MAANQEEYYLSHGKLPFIGKNGQQQLQQSKVLVIGAGGLGCPCLQYLAGCGIAVIGIVDFDVVSVSNLHRQVLYTLQDIGKPKTMVAEEKLAAYNPYIKIRAYQSMVDQLNVLSLVEGYDVIIDCTDNFQVRYLINDACVMLNKPLVYGAIHQSEGHVTVFNYNGSATLRCLFPAADAGDTIQSCADIGAYNIITGVIGLMMANEAIKILLQQPAVLAGKLYQFDVLSGTTRQINYQPTITGREKSMERFQQARDIIEISPELLAEKIQNKEDFILIDVREPEERAVFNIGGEHIPLLQFNQHSLATLSQQATIIIYCQRGGRSLQLTQQLREQGFSAAFSLKGGMQLWISLYP